MPPLASSSENVRGILFMIAASTGFIFNDTCVKLASEDLPIPQVIVIRSLIALPLVLAFCWQQGLLGNLAALGNRTLWWRTVGELGGTAAYLTALARMDIAVATAIAQTTPLAVTGAAALLLGEKVGPRRWTAITIGFLAVVVIIRPGTNGFNSWSLFALVSVGFVVLRDISSRVLPSTIDPLTVTLVTLAALIVLGVAMTPIEPWAPLTIRGLLFCAGAAVTMSLAYVLIVLAMRYGEIAVVSPFRYTFLLWAIAIQIAVFGVAPDGLTLFGSAVLVGTGLYTVLRERKLKGAAAALTSASATVPPPS